MRQLLTIFPALKRTYSAPNRAKGLYDVRTMQGMAAYLGVKFNLHPDDVMKLLTEFFRALGAELFHHRIRFMVKGFGTFVIKYSGHPDGERSILWVKRRHIRARMSDEDDPEDAGPNEEKPPRRYTSVSRLGAWLGSGVETGAMNRAVDPDEVLDGAELPDAEVLDPPAELPSLRGPKCARRK